MNKLLRKYFNHVKINDIIQVLTYSDVLLLSGWGLVNPILAVFITDQIQGGTLILAGTASTVYLLVKSVLQVPIARYIDIKRGEWDDYWLMMLGTAFIALSAFLFIFARYPWHVIAIQVLTGIGGALSYPTWQAIFTRHIDNREEGLEWSLYYTATDLGAAFSAALGAFIAEIFGYQSLFVVVGIMSVAGTLLLAVIAHRFKRRKLKYL